MVKKTLTHVFVFHNLSVLQQIFITHFKIILASSLSIKINK